MENRDFVAAHHAHKGWRLALMSALVCSLPLTAAAAAKLPIDGPYGSKEGCIYAKTEESSGADDFLLLTPTDIRTSVSYCEVAKVKGVKGTTIKATLACEADGEDGKAEVEAVITKSGKDTYKVDFDDGSKLGPFRKCK